MIKDGGIATPSERVPSAAEKSLHRLMPGHQGLREDIASMVRQASRHGFTEADVVRALLRPLLDEKRHCDCWNCRGRRGELEEEGSATEAFQENIS